MASGSVRGLNPFRSGQEQHYSPDVRTARKQTTSDTSFHDRSEDQYGWKKSESEHIIENAQSDHASDNYSDDSDHYETTQTILRQMR